MYRQLPGQVHVPVLLGTQTPASRPVPRPPWLSCLACEAAVLVAQSRGRCEGWRGAHSTAGPAPTASARGPAGVGLRPSRPGFLARLRYPAFSKRAVLSLLDSAH